MSTYITQGTLHCPLVKFVILWFYASNLNLYVCLYHPRDPALPPYKISTINSFKAPYGHLYHLSNLTGTLHCPL